MIKKILYIVCLGFLMTQCSPKVTDSAQGTVEEAKEVVTQTMDSFRSKAPAPGAARTIELGDFTKFQLDNGLDVIVVESHKLPRVSYQIALKHDAVKEGDKAGYISIAGDMINKGTTTKSKAEIDEAIDFIGASFNTNANGLFASSLTKHQGKMLEIVTDALYNPSFPQEEFDKIKKQTLSGLATQKTDPNSIASNVASALNYGKDHAYGEVTTEETINNIELADVKKYYDQFFVPKNAYLIIVGDITPEEAKKQATKNFGQWKHKPFKSPKHNTVAGPNQTKVAFANKDGAVQSVIRVTYPVDLKPGSTESLHASVMNTILGGGVFSGRLMQNLREDKAYTYGAGSSLRSDPVVGSFSVSTSVRNEVTDSSVVQIMYELNKIRTEMISDEDLQLTKNYMAGQFARSLESPQTIARFARNQARYNLAPDHYETYLSRLDAVTKEDVLAIAQKFIRPDNANIVVVGSKDDVSESLARFDQTGGMKFYNFEGNEMKASKAMPDDVTGSAIVNDYIKAIGGSTKLQSVNSLKQTGGMEMMGMNLTVETFQKKPNMSAMKMANGEMVMVEQKYDGTKASVSQMGQSQVITEGPQLDAMKNASKIFEQMYYEKEGYTMDLKGIEPLDGVDCYKLIVTSPAGTKVTQFYAVETSLLSRQVQVQEAPDGQSATSTQDFSDYKAVDGILFPHKVVLSGVAPVPMETIISEVVINPDLGSDVFMVKE